MIILGDLEANLVRHCNFACVSCNHGSAIADRWYMRAASLERDLEMLAKIAHWKFFCLQGGEPLLHENICDFMLVAKHSGIADQIGILTNGSLLPKMPEDFWQTAQRVGLELRVSQYPKLFQSAIDYARDKAAEYGVKFVPHKTDSFIKNFTTHTDGGQRVWDACPWKRCWTVHEGYLSHCPQAMFFPEQFPEKFPAPPEKLVDATKIEGMVEADILYMLQREKPLKTCAICTGGDQDGKIVIPWSEERDKKKWNDQSTV